MDGRLIARARRFSSESIYSSLQRQKREIPILLTHRLTLQCGTSVFAETLEREDSLWASTHSFSSAQWPHWLCYWTDHTQECGVSKHLRHLDTPPPTSYRLFHRISKSKLSKLMKDVSRSSFPELYLQMAMMDVSWNSGTWQEKQTYSSGNLTLQLLCSLLLLNVQSLSW